MFQKCYCNQISYNRMALTVIRLSGKFRASFCFLNSEYFVCVNKPSTFAGTL